MMAKKGQKSTKAEREAGQRNLEAWLKKNPSRGNLRHGIYSKYVRNRYADKNTPEGKSLQVILQAIEKDIGKPFDARQSLLMSLIRSKVIIITQIGKYLESQESIVDYEKGTVPAVLDRTFFAASNSLRSALNELYGDQIKSKKGITYEDVLESMKAKDKGQGAERAPLRLL